MVTFFDTTGVLKKSLLVNRGLPLRINSVNYNCIFPPSNACVDRYIYTYYTTLPPVQGGYIMAFQRCCRNNSINNIVNPGKTGATYWTYLPDTFQTKGYNSAAVFNTLPPNFLCVNRDFIFNHSAIDADGDSLSYYLYTPYQGADEIYNRPRPPAAPPYYGVVWQSGYNTSNMMGGSPVLTIHPQTGLLTVKPNVIGQFVVGIAVNEYRKGVFISTTRRDFQFNVLDCQFQVLSAFSNNITLCNDTVKFSNSTAGVSSYFWDFGDPTTNADTSTMREPVYVYPGFGKYTVKLVVTNGNCKDSSLSLITTRGDTVHFAGTDTSICAGGEVLLGISDTASYTYRWRPALYLNDSTLQRPLSAPLHSIRYIATRFDALCTNTDTVSITIDEVKPHFSLSALADCDDAKLRVDSVSSYPDMTWYLNNEQLTLYQVTSRKINANLPYLLRLVAGNGHCKDSLELSPTISVADSNALLINVFTPDGDDLNDCFSFENMKLQRGCATLYIYNRWGQLLFDSDTDGACWNGNYKNRMVPEGVYYYILKKSGRNLHGSLTLIRH